MSERQRDRETELRAVFAFREIAARDLIAGDGVDAGMDRRGRSTKAVSSVFAAKTQNVSPKR